MALRPSHTTNLHHRHSTSLIAVMIIQFHTFVFVRMLYLVCGSPFARLCLLFTNYRAYNSIVLNVMKLLFSDNPPACVFGG